MKKTTKDDYFQSAYKVMHFIEMHYSHDMTMDDKPAFEKYYNRDPRRTKPENLRTEIYVLIKE